MSAALSGVLADLAAGRLTREAAIEQLRLEFAGAEISAETFALDLFSEATGSGFSVHQADELIGAVLPMTRQRMLPPDLPASATEVRVGAPHTRMRPESSEGASLTAVRGHDASTHARNGQPADAQAATPPDLRPGSIIKGRFELTALVGVGGMGTVYSALDQRRLEARDPHPDVAVKILNSRFKQHPDALIALQREASKAQSLAHPNIVTVFDFDRDGEIVFISMELLQGRSLDQVLRAAGPRGIGREAALPIIRGIAEGLRYAHQKGIVHCDLKPANIFILEDGTPKILDFGIARAVPSAIRGGPHDQFDAGILGAYTEAYATEEMIQGGDPAAADDVFALGIIAYELLTGKHPFGREAAPQARAARSEPAPIRQLRRREWRTLARALAFDRTRRPRDAGEFLRLFFGATRLRNSLIAAILVLAAASGYLWFEDYEKSGPAVPFEQLPLATQRQVTADFAEGNRAWEFYTKAGIANALTDSLTYFADAYRLHEGDREAVRGLERAADAILKRASADVGGRRETARNLAQTSEFLKTYPPVVEAMRQ